MSDKDTKKLLSRITFLEKQNAKLKKELSKQKKYVSKAADIILDSYDDDDYQGQQPILKSKKIRYCESCGKGEVRDLIILNLKYEVCGICGHRKKCK